MSSTIHHLLAGSRPLVIGHRGAAAVAAENTLASFRAALAAGVDLVELDYHHTIDGIPVAFHDKTLDRTTNARDVWGRAAIPVAQTSLDDLARLDAGGWFDPALAGEGIPTLQASLELICARSLTAIERKAGDAATLVELLSRLGVVGRVAVMAFDWEFLAQCRARSRELALVALGDKEFPADAFPRISDAGANVVGWNQKYITRADIEKIRASGRPVWVYTVNEADRARAFAADGVGGIISDDPAAIRAGLERST